MSNSLEALYFENNETLARQRFEELKKDHTEMWLVKSWNQFSDGWWIEFSRPVGRELQICEHYKYVTHT